MAGNVNEAGIFTRDSNLALTADVQYLEPYGTSALNKKMLGIILPGVFRGFNCTPGTGRTVKISSTADTTGTACIEVNGYQITVQQLKDVEVTVPAGQTTLILLEANYGQGVITKQVSSGATLDAARFVTVAKGAAIAPNQIEICRVNVPLSATTLTQAMIDDTFRTRRRVAPIISDAINSTEQYQVASSNAIRLALLAGKAEIDTKIAIGQQGLATDRLTLASNFDWQTYTFKGGEYLYIDWATAKNKPAIDYPNDYYQIMVIGLNDGTNQTLLIRPTNYLQPLAPFMISWTGVKGSRVFRTRALITGNLDINQLTGVTPNSLTLQCHVGEFAQNSSGQAIIANGYPIQEAGSLKVSHSAYGVSQTYTTYGTARTFNRGRNSAGAWGNWNETLTKINLTAHPTDLAAGKVLQVGDFGIGNSIPLTSPTTDFNAFINTVDFNICAVPTAMKNIPVGFSGYGTLSVIGRGASAQTYVTQTLTCKNSKKQWRRTRDDTGFVWSEWAKVYTSLDKPTAEEVGALSLGNGGTITGSIKIKRGNGGAPIRMYQDNGANEYGVFLMKPTSDTFAIYPTAKGGAETGNAAPGIKPFTINLGTGRVTLGNGIDVYGQSSVSGGLISYGTANPLKLASGTGPNDYSAIFRVSENSLHIIPTVKGAALNSDIGPLRPFSMSLETGNVVMKHGMTSTGTTIFTAGIAVASGIGTGMGANSIALGDNDTGFRWNSDGNFDVMANSKVAMNITPYAINPKLDLQLEAGSSSWITGRSQVGVITNRNIVSDASFQPMIRQNHSDRKYVIGGLGKSQFGIFMYLNSRPETSNATDGMAYMGADGAWNVSKLNASEAINTSTTIWAHGNISTDSSMYASAMSASGTITAGNAIKTTATGNGAISWGNAGAMTANNGDIFGTVWNSTGYGGTGVAGKGEWLTGALNKAFAKAAACYTKTESDARYPTKDSVSVIGFVSNNAANPYMRHATSNTAISLATASALNTVSGVANAAKTAAAGAQTTANTGVANAKTAQTAADAGKAAAAAAQTTANAANGRTGTTQVSANLASYKTANGAIYMQTIRAIAVSGSNTKDVTLLNAFPNEIMAIGGAYAEGGGKDTDSWWNAWAINKNTIRVRWQNISGNLTLIVAGR